MGYYLRFLSEDDRPLALGELASGLRNADPGFQLDEDGGLKRGDELLAQLEVNKAGDALVETEIDELRKEAEPGGVATRAVTTRLESVTSVLAVRVLWQQRTARASTKARS